MPDSVNFDQKLFTDEQIDGFLSPSGTNTTKRDYAVAHIISRMLLKKLLDTSIDGVVVSVERLKMLEYCDTFSSHEETPLMCPECGAFTDEPHKRVNTGTEEVDCWLGKAIASAGKVTLADVLKGVKP